MRRSPVETRAKGRAPGEFSPETHRSGRSQNRYTRLHRRVGSSKECIQMKIRPLGDHVLVTRTAEETTSAGGIIIPDTAQEKPQEGKVIAVGNGKRLEDGTLRPVDVKKGDRVLFGKYSGTDVTVEGDEHLLLREDDILGVLS